LNPLEELQLPLFFYLEPEIVEDPLLQQITEINVVYRFLKAKKQDLARLAEEEINRVAENKRILQEMRENKRKIEEENEKGRKAIVDV
jgi:Cytochrome c oxidase assembly protein CtaG/Cox11